MEENTVSVEEFKTEAKSDDISNDQVLITGITWNKNSLSSYHTKKDDEDVELPTQFTLNIPDNVLKQAGKPRNNYYDVIESFVYNFLTHKFNHEVYSCSIWLPMEQMPYEPAKKKS